MSNSLHNSNIKNVAETVENSEPVGLVLTSYYAYLVSASSSLRIDLKINEIKILNKAKASAADCLNDISKANLNAWKYFIN